MTSDREARCPYCGPCYASSVLARHMSMCEPPDPERGDDQNPEG